MRRIWALDFGADTTTVVVAEEKGRHDFKLLAKAEAATQGIQEGIITSIGDVVESVHESVHAAEKMCGLNCEKILYNYDDLGIETASPAGVKSLVGEGQISRSDIADAEKLAIRTTGHFEKSLVLANPIHYLMDGKDSVTNPIGVFGHELEVRLFILLGRAQQLQHLRRVFERAGIDKVQPVVTAVSAAYGVLDEAAMKKRTLVWDLGQDRAQAIVIQQGVCYDFSICRTHTAKLFELSRRLGEETRAVLHRTGFVEEIILTGDLAEKEPLASGLAESVSLPVSVQAPSSPSHLMKTRYASIAGLVYFGFDKQVAARTVKPGKEVLAGIKEKTTSFLSDYF